MTSSANFLHQLFNLDGQVAVVIGATGVLGGALAEGIAKAGAKVVVSGRNGHHGPDRAAAIEAVGGEAFYKSAEATSRASLQELLSATLAHFGRVDILVNCAGVNSSTPYEEISDEDWARVLDTN